MHIPNSRHPIAKVCCVILFSGLMVASSWAAIVWDLNPTQQNAPVGSNSHTYTSSGFSITAYGFDNNGGIGTAHELFYKYKQEVNGAVEFGLGLVNTLDNELQTSPNGPLHFIQFDLTSILVQGLINGRIKVGSIQANEAFAIYGSNALGTLGTQLGGTFGSTFDNQFVNLPNFGQYNFYSIVAAANDVLPIALAADLPPVPEVSTLLSIVALLVLVLAHHVWRMRLRKAG
jgi:hypothetical protein